MPKKNTPRTELGREIRATRTRLRFSQDALGALLSVSGTIISRWETGRYQPPIESLARLADLAGDTETERDTIYSRWVNLAGYREPRAGQNDAAAQAGADIPAATIEGAMARAIIDQVRDAEARLGLVLRLREWAQQSPKDGAGSDEPPGGPPMRPDDQAQLCGSARPGTPP